MEHNDPSVKDFVIEYIRTNHLTPPDPVQPLIPTSSSSIYENVHHPVIPRTSSKSSVAQNGASVRTLHTLSQEIEAAQQEVMDHKLSSALEAVASGSQSIRQRPQRQPSFKALKLPIDHSPRKLDAPIPPPAPPSDAMLPTGTNGAADDEPLALPKLISSSRDEPDGQEHGTLHREVDSWFSDSPHKSRRQSADESAAAQLSGQHRQSQQRHAPNSWYSSDDAQDSNLPAMAASQLLSGKPQQRRKSRPRNMAARGGPRYHYMPVYQPVLTPYGYMLAQTMMPVPVYNRPRRTSVNRFSNRQSSTKGDSTPGSGGGSGGRHVSRKDSGRTRPTSPPLSKAISQSINSLASLDEEVEDGAAASRRRHHSSAEVSSQFFRL